MNPVIKFYQRVFNFLENSRGHKSRRDYIQRILEITPADVSWKTTEDSLYILHDCVNDHENVSDDDLWMETKDGFVQAAFRDLAEMKNPLARKLFGQLKNLVLNDPETVCVVYIKTKKLLEDGSVVYILHVSDAAIFEEKGLKDSPGTEGTYLLKK